MNKESNVNQILIFNFLGNCQDGILINQEVSNKARSVVIMNEFSFSYDRDKLEVFNEEEGSSFEISRLNECDIKEYDDCIVIAKDDFIIRIEEMF